MQYLAHEYVNYILISTWYLTYLMTEIFHKFPQNCLFEDRSDTKYIKIAAVFSM